MIVVNDLLQATMDGIHLEAEQKKMRLRLKRNRGNLRMVADPDRVLQIMTNLLSNAIKYSPEGTFDPQAAGGRYGSACLAGIAALGSTLSRRLAEYMGGDLTLESRPGEGAIFTLWMPHGREPEQRSGWIG